MTTHRKRDLRNRMLTAQGHIRAIAEMIDADAPCVDILRQMQAVRGAMCAINRELWRGYLLDPHCDLHTPNRKRRVRAWNRLRKVIAAS